MGVGAAEALGGLVQDMLRSPVRIGEDVRVPQANDAPTFAFEVGGSAAIRLDTFLMLTAVEFDCQPGFAAGEVDDEGGFDELAGEGWTIA